MKSIYLDNGATTYPKPESVYEAMDYVSRNLAVNAGRGSYKLAREATELIDETREKLLYLVNGKDEMYVVLTPSATMAANLIIQGMDWKKGDICYVSPYEHNAIMRPLHLMEEKYQIEIAQLPLNDDLTIDLGKTEYLFGVKEPKAVFLTQVSNVTGYILPIEKLSKLTKKHKGKVVVDSSQSLGLININLNESLVDYMIFAGHKNLYGPFGIGGFFIRKGENLKTVIAGGTGSDSLNLNMPQSTPGMFEPASPNIVAIAGLKAAIEETDTGYCLEHERKLINYIAKKISRNKNIVTYLPPEHLRTGIMAFNIKSYSASDVGMILDEDFNIAVRTGYHCAPLIHEHLKDKNFTGVVRASVSRFTTMEDVEALVDAVVELSESV